MCVGCEGEDGKWVNCPFAVLTVAGMGVLHSTPAGVSKVMGWDAGSAEDTTLVEKALGKATAEVPMHIT